MDDLIAGDDQPLSRKSVLPGTGFFVPDELEDDLVAERTAAALDGAEAAVVADSDADGLACVALIRERYDDVLLDPESAGDEAASVDALSEEVPEPTPHRVAMIPAGPHNMEDALQRVAEHAEAGVDLFVCDLCPDEFRYVDEELAAAVDVAASVEWYDHHQWDEGVAAKVRETGVELEVGDSEEECTADVVYRSLPHDFDEKYADLAAATRDHDLWIREDPRSDDLADYAYWADPTEYVAVVREHGADLPAWVTELLADRRIEKEALIDLAVSRAELRTIETEASRPPEEHVGDEDADANETPTEYTVGITYGRCSQNEVAEALREKGADAAIVVKPAGSVSIRGTETFQRAHEVAGLVGGGGHPKAAGCKPDIYDDALDHATHWTTRGAVTKRVMLDAFRSVVRG